MDHRRGTYAELAPLYDTWTASVRADIPFYCGLLQRELGGSGTAVEIGAGTGRVTLPLLDHAEQIVAIEPEAAMAAQLRAKLAIADASDRVAVLETTVEDASIDAATAHAVVAPFRTLLHLEQGIETTLERIRGWLVPGGVFAFDVAHLPAGADLGDSGWVLRSHLEPSSGTPAGSIEERLRQQDATHATLRIRVTRGVETRERAHMDLWLPPPGEWAALLSAAGLDIVQASGGFAGEPLSAESPNSVWIARRAADSA